jgi:hypothetical protein
LAFLAFIGLLKYSLKVIRPDTAKKEVKKELCTENDLSFQHTKVYVLTY